MTLLSVTSLTIHFATRRGIVRALDGVSLSIERGTILGLVGESGSGKSVLADAICGLLDPAGQVLEGELRLEGVLLPVAHRSRANQRIARVFQNARASLNPIRTVGQQLADVAGRAHVADRLRDVRMSQDIAHRYSFQLSGGQCQRVGVALALACDPALLIADEPTTGLDVITEAAVLALIRDLAREREMGTLFVTHNLALAATYCDRIAVMHAGQILELADCDQLLRDSRHPYSRKLLGATPQHCASARELITVPGQLPSLLATLPPCRFAARCERHADDCDSGPLPATQVTPGHFVACHHPLS